MCLTDHRHEWQCLTYPQESQTDAPSVGCSVLTYQDQAHYSHTFPKAHVSAETSLCSCSRVADFPCYLRQVVIFGFASQGRCSLSLSWVLTRHVFLVSSLLALFLLTKCLLPICPDSPSSRTGWAWRKSPKNTPYNRSSGSWAGKWLLMRDCLAVPRLPESCVLLKLGHTALR